MRRIWLAALLGSGLVLAACTSDSTPKPPPPPEPVFDDLPAIALDAGAVEVARRYRDPHARATNRLLRAERLQLMAETYAAERFDPWGGPRTFKIVVRRAEINETGGGYSALMDVDLQMLDADRIVEGYDVSSGTAAIAVPRSASQDEREALLDELAEVLLRSLDEKIQERMNDVFVAYVLKVEPAN
jgi:hypothetical protein